MVITALGETVIGFQGREDGHMIELRDAMVVHMMPEGSINMTKYCPLDSSFDSTFNKSLVINIIDQPINVVVEYYQANLQFLKELYFKMQSMTLGADEDGDYVQANASVIH